MELFPRRQSTLLVANRSNEPLEDAAALSKCYRTPGGHLASRSTVPSLYRPLQAGALAVGTNRVFRPNFQLRRT
jgi:hypothetical protein